MRCSASSSSIRRSNRSPRRRSRPPTTTPSSARPPASSARRRSPAPTAFRGAVSHFLRNDVFNARNPFTQFQKITGTDRYIPVTQWNQFGGALGGPIAKNKIFFFGDYQGTRRNTGGSALLRVPSAAERQGDLSGPGRRHLRPGERRGARRPPAVRGKQDSGGASVPAGAEPAQAHPAAEHRRHRARSAQLRRARARSGSTRISRTRAGTITSVEQTHVFGRYSLADYRMDSPGHLRRARGRARLRRGGAVRGRLEDPQPEHRGRFQSHRRLDPA